MGDEANKRYPCSLCYPVGHIDGRGQVDWKFGFYRQNLY